MINMIRTLLSKKARNLINERDISTYEVLQPDFQENDFLTPTDIKKLKAIKEAFDSYQVESLNRLTVKSSGFIGNHLVNLLQGKQQEELWVLCLNTKNEVISSDMIFKGSLNTSVAHPREIFKKAVEHSSARIIIAHNHPSGNTEPSQADIDFTSRIVAAGELMGIECIDHFIIGNEYLSLREHGYM